MRHRQKRYWWVGRRATIVQRPEGLCPPGDFYIDPWRLGGAGRTITTRTRSCGPCARSSHLPPYLATSDGEGPARFGSGQLSLRDSDLWVRPASSPPTACMADSPAPGRPCSRVGPGATPGASGQVWELSLVSF